MCVDTHNFRCCCGLFSLTTATLIIGALNLIGMIASAIESQWITFAFYGVFVVLFSFVIIKPHNAGTRKIIYYLYAIFAALFVLAVIVGVIYIFASDYKKTICANLTSSYSSYQNCLDGINLYLIIVTIAYLLVAIPCQLCVLQILYYGWKEQENINAERQAGDTYNNHNQNHHMAATTNVYPAQPDPNMAGHYQPINNVV